MNKWLYHAAGTAGIVSGFLLLSTGSAQADDRNEDFNTLLGEVFSPTSGLPPLNLPAGLPLGGSPLDSAAGLSDAALGTGLPDPGQLVQLDSDPIGLPTRLADTAFRTLPAPADSGFRTLPAPAPLPADAAGPADTGYSDRRSQTMPVSPQSLPVDAADLLAQAAPITGAQLPPVIAQQLAAEGDYSPELFDGTEPEQLDGLPLGGLPLGGGGLPLVGGGGLPLVGGGGLPLVGGGGLPLVGNQTPAARTTPAATHRSPVPNPAGAPDERPVTGDDPEYTESLI